MSSKAKKSKTEIERQMEMESARIFGKHVSKEKAVVLYAVTLAACAMPMLMGLRLWSRIPEVVPTGLIGFNGEDDSFPRWMVAFGLPAFMCLMNTIAHGQLWFNQKRMTLPSTPVRLLGRWGFPVLSVVFCSGMILEAVDTPLSLPFVTPCVMGLALLMLGAHMWDCPRDARVALRFSFTEQSPDAWKTVHRFAGWLWMAAGLVVLAGVMVTSGSTPLTAAVILLSLAAPLAYGQMRPRR